MPSKLSVGVLLDSDIVPNWAFKMLSILQQSNYAEIKLLVKNKNRNINKKKLPNTLLSIYQKIDKKIFRLKIDAQQPKNINNLFKASTLPILEVLPESGKSGYAIRDTDVQKINEFSIDVFIKIGFPMLVGDILKTSRYGIWAFYHDEKFRNNARPVGAWEVLTGKPETKISLQMVTEDIENSITAYCAFTSTDNLSITRNANKVFWKCSMLFPRMIEIIFKKGKVDLNQRTEQPDREQVIAGAISSGCTQEKVTLLILVLRNLFIKLRNKIISLFYFNQWILLFQFDSPGVISTDFEKFIKIIPPKDRFWADPHVIYKNDRYYIFIEEYIYNEGKAHISIITMDEKGNYSKPEKVMEKDYHLSYPFIFDDQNNLFMIPQAKGKVGISLYKCTEFPKTWKLEKKLIPNIEAADATVFYYQKKYWLFVCLRVSSEAPNNSINDELFLYYSDELVTDKWISHPENPIISDVRKARPAGRLLEQNGRLFRPSQDCSKRYGYGIRIHQITTLSETRYREKTVASYYPGRGTGVLAQHTYSRNGNIIVIDAMVRRKRPLKYQIT